VIVPKTGLSTVQTVGSLEVIFYKLKSLQFFFKLNFMNNLHFSLMPNLLDSNFVCTGGEYPCIISSQHRVV
jgi:hypothetical protein